MASVVVQIQFVAGVVFDQVVPLLPEVVDFGKYPIRPA